MTNYDEIKDISVSDIDSLVWLIKKVNHIDFCGKCSKKCYHCYEDCDGNQGITDWLNSELKN